jgi:hypothetical protein
MRERERERERESEGEREKERDMSGLEIEWRVTYYFLANFCKSFSRFSRLAVKREF